jgi:hypothetical protein
MNHQNPAHLRISYFPPSQILISAAPEGIFIAQVSHSDENSSNSYDLSFNLLVEPLVIGIIPPTCIPLIMWLISVVAFWLVFGSRLTRLVNEEAFHSFHDVRDPIKEA